MRQAGPWWPQGRARGIRWAWTPVVAAIAALSLPLEATAGAWSQPAGAWYMEISGRALSTDNEFDFEGHSRPIFEERISFTDATYRESSLSLYAEYGLPARLTGLVQLPLKRSQARRTELGGSYFDSRGLRLSTAGLADLALGLRWQWLTHPVSSLQVTGKLPLGYAETPSNDGPPLGTADTDLDIQWLVGTGLGVPGLWATGGVGYRYRGGPRSDEWLAEAETGYQRGSWTGQFKLFASRSREDPIDLVGSPVVTPLPGGGGDFVVLVGDQDVTSIEPSLSWNWNYRTALRAGAAHVVSGRNTVGGTTWFASLVFRGGRP